MCLRKGETREHNSRKGSKFHIKHEKILGNHIPLRLIDVFVKIALMGRNMRVRDETLVKKLDKFPKSYSLVHYLISIVQ